ncbi:MAG: polysaccharide deacetylase family protein [Gemmatimonadales bacterium]
MIGRSLFTGLRHSWEKNWPEARALLGGEFSAFVMSSRPAELGTEIPVFCYHIVDPEEFEQDLEFLARNGYTAVDADTLLEHMRCTAQAPENSVVLSIDDGALNLSESAFPMLQKYGMKAVGFIAPGLHPGEARLRRLGMETEISRPCTWSEIRKMEESGHLDFQAHTLEHRYVPRWPEPVDLTGWNPRLVDCLRGDPLPMREAFCQSRRTMEERLGKKVLHMAFPKFKGTVEALRLGAECGFQAFWWGHLPGHDGNRPGQDPRFISRMDALYLRRLPGDGRLSGSNLLKRRLALVASKWRS